MPTRSANGSAPSRRISAGILLYRRSPALEVLLGHMGGPLWSRRHEAAWTVPKGEPEQGEDLWDCAQREFREEVGVPLPGGPVHPLGTIRQSGGKEVTAWAVEGDVALEDFAPGTFEMEWPPRSGRRGIFPELDRIAWVSIDDARPLLVRAQTEFLDRLGAVLTE